MASDTRTSPRSPHEHGIPVHGEADDVLAVGVVAEHPYILPVLVDIDVERVGEADVEEDLRLPHGGPGVPDVPVHEEGLDFRAVGEASFVPVQVDVSELLGLPVEAGVDVVVDPDAGRTCVGGERIEDAQ